jgi:hypothetical protein
LALSRARRTRRPLDASAPDYWTVGSMIDWMFRSRQSGRITIIQFPNLALWVFIAASVVNLIVRPSDVTATVVNVVATAALVVWSLDEMVRGVNPWRRILGSATLAWEALQFAGH